MMSMLRFGASCCFSSDKPPTDDEIMAIIDRTRTSNASLGNLVGNAQRSVRTFTRATLWMPQFTLMG